ncbi:hypothetical protein ACFL20_02695 [Spirochaetota bacterium]
MRPPVCAICGKDLTGDDGGLIYFKKCPKDIEWDIRMEKEGMAGHPPYAEWFCGEHHIKAIELKGHTASEARKILKS